MIKLVRVDHRFLHGQVVFTWTKTLGIDCILIANDAVAEDTLRMSALRMAKPQETKLVMKSIDDSIEALNSGVTDKYKLLILVETIKDAWRLAEKVELFQKINLGGTKMADDRKQISKAVFVSEDDCEMLKKMHQKGIKIEAQMVPDDAACDVMKLIGQ